MCAEAQGLLGAKVVADMDIHYLMEGKGQVMYTHKTEEREVSIGLRL